MNIYCNPESSCNDPEPNHQTSKDKSLHNKSRQKTTPNNKIQSYHQSTPKSMGKFKRTNPSLQNTKPISPHPQKSDYDQLNNPQVNYVKSQQPLNYQSKCHQGALITNLTTSRQTARTSQGKTILYLSPSKQHRILLNERNSPTRDKYQLQNQDLKSVKSIKSGKSSSKGSKTQNQKYSLYWKMKAHEYLENNFKLSQEIGQLKKKLGKYQILLPSEGSVTNSELNFSETQSQNKTQKSIPVYIVELQHKNYLQQIAQLQISNRLKGSVIQNMQNKIIELTQQIKGQQQKSELLQKMRRQISELQLKNKKLSKEHQQASKLNKVYQTQKTLQEAKQKSKPPIYIQYSEFGEYKFQKDLQKHRYRSLQ